MSEDSQYDAWNPGLDSSVPARLRPFVTLYRPENSTTTFAQAKDAADFCGATPPEMVAFTFDRLVTHEILIRVTADLHVPDGQAYEDLGLNLRQMAADIAARHVAPQREAIKAVYDSLSDELRVCLRRHLDEAFGRNQSAKQQSATPAAPSMWGRLLGRKTASPASSNASVTASGPTDQVALERLQTNLQIAENETDQTCLDALIAVVGGVIGRRGRVPADPDLLVQMAHVRALNRLGSRRIGELIDPLIRAAAKACEFMLLPPQAEPVVLNVKGASASGKSTLRHLQRELAERLGAPWQEFALVSPDYWRKHLLDYNSLGEDYKYAAVLTGQELEIIDRKLDDHFARKAERGQMPHLLIDRFRFDSFVSSAKGEDVGNLLSRFGHRVFIFVMITPPAATVERAWNRGKSTGRYKAVDDLLYHNIEAYTGIPNMFFTWINKAKQRVHFEFLDNSVPLGDRPRTVAFGWNGRLVVLDAQLLSRMDEYRHINVDATCPEEVLMPCPDHARRFLDDCMQRVPEILFLGDDGTHVMAEVRDGKCRFQRDGFLSSLNLCADCPPDSAETDRVIDVATERSFTLGAWPGDD